MNKSTVSEFNVENRFSDCVFMKLYRTPTQASLLLPQYPHQYSHIVGEYVTDDVRVGEYVTELHSSSNLPRTVLVDLKLTIRFGQQEIKIGSKGSACFGLRRGELKLTLKTGMIPLEKMGLTAQFETEYELEEQREKGMESGATLSISPSIATKDTSKESSKVKSKVFQVCTTGTEEKPKWVFESKIPKSGLLEGQLTEAPLGIVEIRASPCNFEAIFTARRQSDIVLTEGSFLLAKDIVRSKSACLEREIFLRYIAPKLQPFLSRIEGAL